MGVDIHENITVPDATEVNLVDLRDELEHVKDELTFIQNENERLYKELTEADKELDRVHELMLHTADNSAIEMLKKWHAAFIKITETSKLYNGFAVGDIGSIAQENKKTFVDLMKETEEVLQDGTKRGKICECGTGPTPHIFGADPKC